MSGIKNAGMNVQEYVYDFSVDGGAQGSIILSDKNGYANLPVGAYVHGVYAKVVTSVTSGGSATCEWGTSGDTDGYSGTAIAKATLAADYVINSEEGAGALVWDNTNDCSKSYLVTNAATGTFYFKINVADLTAGKLVFAVHYSLMNS
jgi:hypothetical protein